MSISANESIRNIAIIAHVDHGKTTLVDALFRQSGTFRENQEVDDRVMDSMDLERERGITIAAKNCAVTWKGVKINIIDTPGHADFGGEVERSLVMADGAILLVDSSEGPLPQTRFVLKKALERGLAIMVVVNKIDRKDARPEEVLDEVYDLFIDLDANEEQLDFPVLYAIGREGMAKTSLDGEGTDLTPLFDAILEHIPAPRYDATAPFQMLVADLGYSDFLGRLAIGRVMNGVAHQNETLVCMGENGEVKQLRVTRLQTYKGPSLVDATEATPGDTIVLSGIENVTIGDTICTAQAPKALPRITVDEPTVSMKFAINTSPLAGREGKLVQSRKILERLERECLANVAIKVEQSEDKRQLHGQGPRRVPDGHPDRDHAPRGLRAVRGPPRGHLQGKGRQASGAHRARVRGLRRGLHGRGHGKALHAQGPHGELGEQRQGPGAHGVLRALARAHRLPRRVPHGHQGHGHPELPTWRATNRTGAISPPGSRAPWWPTAPAWAWPTASTTWSRAARCSSPPATRCTRA